MDYDFKIKNVYGDPVLERDGSGFCIEKHPDGDIWFNSSRGNTTFRIDCYNRRADSDDEHKTFLAFYGLMKNIIGRYYLSGDAHDEDNGLPKDFIDLKNHTITWRSDSDLREVLRIKYTKDAIFVSIYRSDDPEFKKSIKVRVRTSGSNYKDYYEEIEDFFRVVSKIAWEPQSILGRKIGNQ